MRNVEQLYNMHSINLMPSMLKQFLDFRIHFFKTIIIIFRRSLLYFFIK